MFEEAFFDDVPPTKWGDGSKCCSFFGKKLGRNLKALMILMKYSTLNGKTYDTSFELEQDFANISNLLDLPTMDVKKLTHPPYMQVQYKKTHLKCKVHFNSMQCFS